MLAKIGTLDYMSWLEFSTWSFAKGDGVANMFRTSIKTFCLILWNSALWKEKEYARSKL